MIDASIGLGEKMLNRTQEEVIHKIMGYATPDNPTDPFLVRSYVLSLFLTYENAAKINEITGIVIISPADLADWDNIQRFSVIPDIIWALDQLTHNLDMTQAAQTMGGICALIWLSGNDADTSEMMVQDILKLAESFLKPEHAIFSTPDQSIIA